MMIFLGIFVLLGICFAGLVWYLPDPLNDEDAEVNAAIGIKRSLHATIIKACPNCGAPGVDGYGNVITGQCPNCGTDRPEPINKGEIWSQTAKF